MSGFGATTISDKDDIAINDWKFPSLKYISISELFGERTHVVSPSGLVEREQFYRTLVGLQSGKQKEEEELITFAEKMERINKEKNKQEEFFEPVREYVGEKDIQGLGFEARKSLIIPIPSSKDMV